MAIITIDKAYLEFGSHLLLDNVNFALEKNEKIGLIGRNGSGKSSLLKAIAGAIDLDSGNIYISNSLKIIYIPQEPIFNCSNTIAQEIFASVTGLQDSFARYHTVLKLLEDSNIDSTQSCQLLLELDALQNNLEQSNLWGVKNHIDKLLADLSLNGNWCIANLSGGMKKKVAFAKALINNPDVILLDEPTNHLDITTTIWLEGIIKNFTGSVILITHDRAFLDNTVNKIIELDRGRLSAYPGSYAAYKTWKTNQLYNENRINQEFDKFLAKEEIWIRKGVEARRTRNEGRVRRLQELRSLHKNRREELGKVKFTVDEGTLSGKIVVSCEQVGFKFNDKTILHNFSTTIMRGDKVALIGPNGVGKSTLLKILLGQLKPDSGKVTVGTKTTIAYFDQFREQLDEESPIYNVVSQGQDFIEINNRKVHIATYLEEFLFTPDRFYSPVKSLSGGERNRLLLARLFSRSANVLVLDEPTNDLDIETLELLEELLFNYNGTIFLVSHDREFVDNVVTESLVLLGDGNILEITGGYSDWVRYSKNQPAAVSNSHTVTVRNKSNITTTSNKLSYKETKELSEMISVLDQLEREQTELTQSLSDSAIYAQTPDIALKHQNRLHEVTKAIEDKLARWEYLENRQKTT